MNQYEINLKTMAIIPISKTSSQVIEEDNKIIVNKTPFEIIDHSCRFFGSSYNGRHDGSKEILGINYKIPILVEESNDIIFFPTTSSRLNNCYWISLNKINNYKKHFKNSRIIFKNGEELILNISLGSLENQILRSTLLESNIRKRQKMS